MNIFFGIRGLNKTFEVFSAPSNVRIQVNQDVLVKFSDGVWVVTVIDFPLLADRNIDLYNKFHGYINSPEEKIINHNYDYEQKNIEEIKNYIEVNQINMEIIDVKMNFNRTKLNVYYNSHGDSINLKKLCEYFEEQFKLNVEFIQKYLSDYCIEHGFTREFGIADSNISLRKDEKILIKRIDGIWTGKILRKNCNKKKTEDQISVLCKIDQEIQKILNYILEQENFALNICKREVEQEKLNMKLLKAEYNLNMKKIFFYYTAEGRVDFRNLVKSLAGQLKKRIEMHQIGIRDELRTFPTIGICGQQTCCSRFLHKFKPVTLKMAKMQNLDISTEKITGVCGRLLCCLEYEFPTYYDYISKINKTFPKKFYFAEDKNSSYTVISFSPINNKIILFDLADHKKISFDFDELAKRNIVAIDKSKPFDILNKRSELDDKG